MFDFISQCILTPGHKTHVGRMWNSNLEMTRNLRKGSAPLSQNVTGIHKFFGNQSHFWEAGSHFWETGGEPFLEKRKVLTHYRFLTTNSW